MVKWKKIMPYLSKKIWANYQILKNFFAENYPKIKVADLESTYLAWVDCSCLNLSGEEIKNKLIREGKLYINDGEMYHSPMNSFIRVNLACTRVTLKDALSRFKKVFC